MSKEHDMQQFESFTKRVGQKGQALREAMERMIKEVESSSPNNGASVSGNQVEGKIGEVAVALLVGGKNQDGVCRDVIVEGEDGEKRIEVKTRTRREKSGWNETSKFSRTTQPDAPEYVALVVLQHDYTPEKIWILPWGYACTRLRTRTENEREIHVIDMDHPSDSPYEVYPTLGEKGGIILKELREMGYEDSERGSPKV